VTAYGELECHTIAQSFDTAIDLSILDVDSGDVYACAATDDSQCKYQTYDIASQPTVSSVALSSATEISFTGTNFPSDECEAVFLGMVSNSCVRSLDSSISATFDFGVPTSSTDVTPELRFIASDGTHYALVDVTAIISNPLSISLTEPTQQSSFAGGCPLKVTASGLTSDILLGKSEIRVCEKPCMIDEAASSSSAY
jgi:hypothetical protein